MNKSAVALAADSAVSIPYGRGYKIYNTHKLFNLCQSNPVGVMVYENADLMSVPWETIIKQYRKQLGNAAFSTLEEHGTNFISYLDNTPLLFPESVQDETALRTVAWHLSDLTDRIDKQIKAITLKAKASEAKIKRTYRETINGWHETLKTRSSLPDTSGSLEKEVLTKYGAQFDKIIVEIFQSAPLTDNLKKALLSISVWLLTKDLSGLNLYQSYSGVVIAGFGESDLYPAVSTYRVESVVLNQLRYLHLAGKSDRITADETSSIVPFAQDEMVAGFMEGIDPKFYERIFTEMSSILTDVYPVEIVKKLPGLTKKRKEALLIELKKIGPDLIKVFNEMIKKHKREKHVDPIVRAVSALPKEELASMAEALVSLTSTKRRVTLDAETVGGPIDVAVISKGDGFIWIKRKHYFDADKNPQFFSRYQR
ncbi:MAG: hypothetical protein AUJ04_02515 [Acidobacteria bacterium 13_1_40CM_3_55_6]|nr:MAG: hypothetical protein AUJ04_02515 [Acidobacteria bacterium 13_1_40CM_3_55_6]